MTHAFACLLVRINSNNVKDLPAHLHQDIHKIIEISENFQRIFRRTKIEDVDGKIQHNYAG